VKVKNLMQTSAKFCKVFALKLLPFFVQNGSALFVGCASTFIIFRPARPTLCFVCLRGSHAARPPRVGHSWLKQLCTTAEMDSIGRSRMLSTASQGVQVIY